MRHNQDAAVASVTVADAARSALLADLPGRVAGCFPRRPSTSMALPGCAPTRRSSATHPEVYPRGSAYSRELGDRFADVLRPFGHRLGPPGTDAGAAVRACFTTVFSALVLRVAYGPGFAAEAADDDTYAAQLARMSASYLLSGG